MMMHVLRRITWRALLVTQGLAVLFAIAPWLEQWGVPWQPPLTRGLLTQCIGALLVMLGAFAADEYVRRGMSLLRAFASMLLGASLLTSLIVFWLAPHAAADPPKQLAGLLTSFFLVSAYWGTPMLVYLNRESATRLLAVVEEGELRRVQAERRLVESDLAAAQAEINPAALMQQLAHLRDAYAAGNPGADGELEQLIAGLRDTVARCNR